MRRDIAKLLETGQEATARIRVHPIACFIFGFKILNNDVTRNLFLIFYIFNAVIDI
jgi:hypothetical protein